MQKPVRYLSPILAAALAIGCDSGSSTPSTESAKTDTPPPTDTPVVTKGSSKKQRPNNDPVKVMPKPVPRGDL